MDSSQIMASSEINAPADRLFAAGQSLASASAQTGREAKGGSDVAQVEIADAVASQINDAGEFVRSLTLASANALRQGYDRLRASSEEAVGTLENSQEAAVESVRMMSLKLVDVAQANTLAFFDCARACVRARTPAHAIVAEMEMLRRQFENVCAANMELLDLGQSVSNDLAAPFWLPMMKAA